ncbi:hypothetical protein J6590_034028 [Homalodisca vitripennis]|nr:hypothetical protein J6590_034028 [Homalodisca vitripennis]
MGASRLEVGGYNWSSRVWNCLAHLYSQILKVVYKFFSSAPCYRILGLFLLSQFHTRCISMAQVRHIHTKEQLIVGKPCIHTILSFSPSSARRLTLYGLVVYSAAGGTVIKSTSLPRFPGRDMIAAEVSGTATSTIQTGCGQLRRKSVDDSQPYVRGNERRRDDRRGENREAQFMCLPCRE